MTKLKKIISTLFLIIITFLIGCQKPKTIKEEKLSQPVRQIKNVTFPTDLTFAPNGDLYIIEKTGALKVVKRGSARPKKLRKIKVPSLIGYNEVGLLGITQSLKFSKNNYLYLYHTYRKKGKLYNRVIRLNAKHPRRRGKIIIDNIIGGRIHDGGKLQFGPDGKLYIATGETGDKSLAQNKKSLNGKILRLNADGSIPAGNPFGNAVWSYGHRNIFGMAFDSQGRLFITENGPEKDDEVNEVIKGKNYGWPDVTGFSRNFQNPLITYEDVNAPTGIIFYTGDKYPRLKNHLIFGDWNNGNIHRLTIKGGKTTDKVIMGLKSVTALAQSPDGFIYAATRDALVRLKF